jgi:two-component system phosphate regulon sensor histidine kinase PhoR
VQLAPKQAPQLDAQGRSRRMNEVALIAVAFAVILLGVAFVLYAGEKERRLNALKADFVANVSHELKTPLSVVRMFGEMLLTNRVRSEEKRQEYLEIICRESERLSSLIENVLDFAALERGKKKFALREGDLVDVVTRAVETFRYRIEREGTEVQVERPTEIPQVSMDEQAVLLAVINLLDNAVKYGDGSPVTVSVAAGKNEVSVSVRDRGPGIPKEDLKRVFERFYRTRRKELARGSGIGLALVKHIAEAHGGHAWAENAPDGGAIVGFTIAMRRPKRAPIPTPTSAEATNTEAAE